MVVACTALRPLVRKAWRAASSHERSRTKTRQTNWTRTQTVVTLATNGISQPYKVTRAADDEDPTGSEVELNDMHPSKIVKTECISVSSERRSNNDSLPGEDGTCREWRAASSLQ